MTAQRFTNFLRVFFCFLTSLRKEFTEGLKLLPGTAKIHMTVDDFEIITENGKHLGADGAFIQCFGGEIGTFFSGQVPKKKSVYNL